MHLGHTIVVHEKINSRAEHRVATCFMNDNWFTAGFAMKWKNNNNNTLVTLVQAWIYQYKYEENKVQILSLEANLSYL